MKSSINTISHDLFLLIQLITHLAYLMAISIHIVNHRVSIHAYCMQLVALLNHLASEPREVFGLQMRDQGGDVLFWQIVRETEGHEL